MATMKAPQRTWTSQYKLAEECLLKHGIRGADAALAEFKKRELAPATSDTRGQLDGRGYAVQKQFSVLVSGLLPLSCSDDFTAKGLGKSATGCVFINDRIQKPGWTKSLARPLNHSSNGLSPISTTLCRLLDPESGFQQGGIGWMQTRRTDKFICARKANY
jgi:hypothetical protein